MNKFIEKQQENVRHLFDLIKENPDLRIVPMVEAEIVPSDDWAWWIAGWGKASIEEITSYADGERLYVRSKDESDLEEEIYDQLAMDNTSWSDTYTEEQTQEKLKEVIWEKVIAVNIVTP